REALSEMPSDEEREQRRAHHDLGRRHGHEDQEVREAASAEAIADERERDQRPEGGRDEGREHGNLETYSERGPETGVVERVRPVLEREALPRVVEAAGRVVEREQDDDRDRQEQVDERERRVEREHVVTHPGEAQGTTAR